MERDGQAFDTDASMESVPALRLCKCGRAPHRKGQRNCLLCNREANKKYRESLKRETARWEILALRQKK
jgi:hypothetical protein